ncbi:MAG TPA: alkaline phosphatase D family protein, partial [Planctomycetaceae bacterium]|nr:alkaline phosphatase D family protein [Planctomycetaceae bacterium]
PERSLADQPLTFEVADDFAFRSVVLTADVAATDFGPDRDYTVHLDLEGHLAPGHVYYYRFSYRATFSRIGRCRTLPRAESNPASLKLGVVSCQDYTNGYYGAYAHLSREDVDFVVHLGDLIYETSGDPDFQALPFPDRTFALPSGQPAAVGLEDYRFLYRKYRSDPWFQQCLENHTLIALWDDHEAANDAYWDYDRDTLGAPTHPLSENQPDGGDPAALKQLKFDSQRAWAEYLPARVTVNPGATHPFDYLSIYRSFRFGRLVDLFCTDERTYRSPHPCGEDERMLTFGCGHQSSPDQTMLGPTQKEWFVSGMAGSSALWKVWANEVFLGQMKLGPTDARRFYLNLDAWDGYEAERTEILQAFVNAGLRNVIALTGDLHCYIASYLKVDYLDRSNRPGTNLVGVEFMTPAITSATLVDFLKQTLNPAEFRELQAADAAQPTQHLFENLAMATNPHIRFFDGQEWGYSIVEFTPTACTYTAYGVDKSVNSANAPRRLVRKLRVPVNRVQIEDLA